MCHLLTQAPISIKELSEMTAIKTDDIVDTLQQLNLIQYQKGQHILYAAPKVVEKYLKQVSWDANRHHD
jgi:histone acetyltransferase MYST1